MSERESAPHCKECEIGPGYRVTPCAGCGHEWHLLVPADGPFLCPRCDKAPR